MTDLERAARQIEFAHDYTLRLLEDIDPADWFRIPAAGVSHVAWQMGHLTFAAYRLGLVRIRGQAPMDKALISDEFLKVFAPTTSPVADPSAYPTPEAIRAAFDRVHTRVQLELPGHDTARLAEPLDPPHPRAKTKLDSLFWCAAHEMMHAGQIGLLRRQLGHKPLW